ncbi:hypothetical protein BE17_23770 [Sorangium cellulosum]|uniref:Uncharacterized protein n=1 Tax=Sorangium cellulosum TaxID=56 RepID=A0A150R9H7_SORCE|nr:hypothetical protein BE17_23770 [Sorangium cellulosum]
MSNTGISYEEYVTGLRAEAVRIFEAVGASDPEEVPKLHTNFGDRVISESGAIILTSTRVEGWFSVTVDGRRVPVAVFQTFMTRSPMNTIVLGVDRKDYASDRDFLQRVREVLRNEARRVPV